MESVPETHSVHILLCGHSVGHILAVEKRFNPRHIDLLTTSELLQNANDLLSSMGKSSHYVTEIPAFTSSSITTSISLIIERYKDLKLVYPKEKFYFGITGGTNTMAVSVAYAALILGVDMHYVLEIRENDPKDQIIFFHPSQILNELKVRIRPGVE